MIKEKHIQLKNYVRVSKMSKIKDLVAIAEGIDDLMPEPHKYGKDFAEAVRQADIKRMSEQVYAKTLHRENLRSWLRANAEYEAGEDENGHTEYYFENFEDLCEQACEGNLMDYIEDQHLDLTDEEYSKILYSARDWLADTLADFEEECIQDMVSDQKYTLDELAERNGEC